MKEDIHSDSSPEYWKEMGNDFFQKGDYIKSIEYYSKAIELNPEYAPAWNNLGLALLKIGKTNEANECKIRLKQIQLKNAEKFTDKNTQQPIVDLKKIKAKYENGEITYQDYQNAISSQSIFRNVENAEINKMSDRQPIIKNISDEASLPIKDGKILENGSNFQDSIESQIKRIGAGGLLYRKEIKELPHILWEDEHIEKLTQGWYNNGTGILVATNKRLIFVDKGLVYGLRVEDFPYEKITSIKYKTGLALGEITVFTSGNNSTIENILKSHVKPFAEYVRARITRKMDHASAPITQLKPDSDHITQLERLAALKEKGILTDEEFNEQKRKILGS